ncbi:NAD(P)/FAD-dependent oxidoreductase [Helicobacter cetorum]|uniref:D-amino acid dehydrogenase n=1 Tax=Helicobacter cetorum (strain ATCC BAA-429 / MIT 00-7128) TaxID=182217 RepID=I0EP84_HELC0|nr:FAD-dependent oxidoreductase [Helicobacter cetorum]AFI04753.1 D-amino acid dehydrogenase [Helicobacter cetorum MIT 00-7128]
MKKDIIIIGGGIVGLSCAYSMHKLGHKVCVIEKGDGTNCTSFGNAGLISPFKEAPLASPGVVLDTLKLMLKNQAPLKFHFGLNPKLFKWIYKFIQSANAKSKHRTMALFERYGWLSIEMYHQMLEDGMDFWYKEDGLLMIYTLQENFEKKLKTCDDSGAYKILNPKETQEYMPIAKDNICGSVLLTENAHVDPGEVMLSLQKYLKEVGVEFRYNEEVIDFEFKSNLVDSIITNKGRLQAEKIILATGANPTTIKKTKNDFLMMGAKGYSITFKMPEELKPKTSSLFADIFMAMTPRRDTVRITSKLELNTSNPLVDKEQIENMKRNLATFTHAFEMKDPIEWCGFRPLTPNDIPYLGFDKQFKNLIHATGLGWLGITFGPAIGKLIADLSKDGANEKNTDIMLFSAFFRD